MGNKAAKKAKVNLENFSARGSLCPICKKNFRNGCSHSVAEAKDNLFAKYVKALVN